VLPRCVYERGGERMFNKSAGVRRRFEPFDNRNISPRKSTSKCWLRSVGLRRCLTRTCAIQQWRLSCARFATHTRSMRLLSHVDTLQSAGRVGGTCIATYTRIRRVCRQRLQIARPPSYNVLCDRRLRECPICRNSIDHVQDVYRT
jgi:hypothetical protein